MVVVIGSPPSPERRRGLSRWVRRGGGALLASAVVHAAAAVTVGGVLARGTRGGEHRAEMVELELAPAVETAAMMPMPAGAAPAAPAEPVRAHPAPRRRVAVRSAALASAPAAVESPVVAAPRFVMSAGTVATRAAAAPASPRGWPSLDAASADGEAGTTFGEGDVNEPARLMTASPLVYPAAARAAAIELDFPVEIVVDPAGHVVSARALRHAGYGLDEAALRAIREYRFSPARRAGRTVPVRMRWTVQFRLR